MGSATESANFTDNGSAGGYENERRVFMKTKSVFLERNVFRTMEKAERSDRKIHIDLLRILACFSVIMLHSSSQHWYELPVTDYRWIICNTYDALFRFGVPVFVMISGALFLGREREVDLKRLYRKNILRLVTAYWFWSFMYGLWDCREWFGAEGTVWQDYVMEFLLGRYHLWFIPMLAGIYVILPILKTWTEHASRKQVEYFLVLFLILQIGVATLKIPGLSSMAELILQFINVELACSYVGYFILGYYLQKYRPGKTERKRLYLLGGVGAICAMLVSAGVSGWKGWTNAAAFDSFSLFTCLVSVALFVFFQEKVSGWKCGDRMYKRVRELSANTFGVYLVHILIMEALQSAGLDSMSLFGKEISGIWGIPCLAVFCFLTGNLVIALIRRIPVAGKYIC